MLAVAGELCKPFAIVPGAHTAGGSPAAEFTQEISPASVWGCNLKVRSWPERLFRREFESETPCASTAGAKTLPTLGTALSAVDQLVGSAFQLGPRRESQRGLRVIFRN